MLLWALCLLVSAACICGALIYPRVRPYQPPSFDETAVKGEPSPPEDLGYGVGGVGGKSFQVGLASKWIRTEDGSLPIWFTNPATNQAYLLMRITQAGRESILYESGLLRPGEYIKALSPLKKLSPDPMEIDVAIYSFEPETYYSLGTIHLTGELS